MYLSAHPSVCPLTLHLSIHMLFGKYCYPYYKCNLSIHLWFTLSKHPFIFYLSANQYIHKPIHPSIHLPFIHLPIQPSIYPPNISIHPLSIYPFIHPFHLSPFHISIRPSIQPSILSFQPVIHDSYIKGRGICYHFCGMEHMKEPLLLTGKSSPYSGGSGFLL